MIPPSKLIAVSVTLLLLSGCSSRQAPTTPSPRTIVLLLVDGLRIDRAAELTDDVLAPFLAENVTVFERAYAPSSLAEQSLSALFSGRMPTHGGSIGLAEAQPASEALTLATRLRRAGYASAFVSQSNWAGRPGFTRGFDDVQVAPESGWMSDEIAQRALRAADDWQTANKEKPFFLVVHWAAPEVDPAQAPESAVADYDQQTNTTARAIADLLGQLENKSLLADAVVVLTAGHGYELLEHGGVGSGWTLDEEVIRVPLILRGVGEAHNTQATSTLQLAPTLLEIALAKDEGATEQRGQRSLLFGDESNDPAPVLSELVVRERAISRAVIQGDTKYLRVLREVPLEDREVVARGYEELQAAMLAGAIETPSLFGDPRRESLTRLTTASYNETELPLADNTEALSQLRAVLRDYQRLCDNEGFAPPQITNRLPIDASDVENLEILGYL